MGGGGGGVVVVVGAGVVVVVVGSGVVVVVVVVVGAGAGYIGALCWVPTGECTLAFLAKTIVLWEFLLVELTRLYTELSTTACCTW